MATGCRERLAVFGNDYPTPDGTCIRDYVHVVDIARAHVRAVERVVGKPGVSIHNLGTGRGHSVLEVVEAFERASGVAIPYEIVPRRPGDVAMLRADSSLARRELGWTRHLRPRPHLRGPLALAFGAPACIVRRIGPDFQRAFCLAPLYALKTGQNPPAPAGR